MDAHTYIEKLIEENNKLRNMLEKERREHKQELEDQENNFDKEKKMIIDKFDREISSMFQELQHR